MKLLHLISSTNPRAGGPIEGVKQLCSQYRDLGVEAEIACCDAPNSPWHNDPKLPKIHALGPSKGKYAYTSKLKKWLKINSTKYDAIIIDGLWQYHGRAAHQILAKSQTPYFVFTHGMLDPWFKHTYPIKHIKKWLYWPWAEYRTLRDARAVIFTCEEERILARQSFWLYSVNEAVTAYGTDTPPLNHQELKDRFLIKHPELSGKRLILFLSRIHEKKGCDLLIQAFAEVASKDDNLHLVMAGPNQTGWMDSLISLTKSLGISDRVSWPGMLQGDDKWGAFYSADVFCLPSHQENFGIVVAEALACGKPVLISNKVNIWREIDLDKAGFISDDTIDGTISNLNKWLSLSPKDYLAMSDRARSCFENRFKISVAAQTLINILRSHTKSH